MVSFLSTSFFASMINIFIFHLPTLKLRVIIILLTNRPEIILLTAHITKNQVVFALLLFLDQYKMPNNKECVFNKNWLLCSKYSIWLCKLSAKRKSCCSICNKDSDIANMGIAALNSHAADKKHVDNMASRVQKLNILSKKENASSDAKPCSSKDTSSTI